MIVSRDALRPPPKLNNMPSINFTALIKKFSKKQLVSLDSELEIILRTSDVTIVSVLNELARADSNVKVVISDEVAEPTLQD